MNKLFRIAAWLAFAFLVNTPGIVVAEPLPEVGAPLSTSTAALDLEYEEIILGTWNQVSDNILVAARVEGAYYLIQRSTSGSYFVPRGRNMLGLPSVTITNPGFDLDLIASNESDIGGLVPPDNFPAAAFAALGFEYDSGSGEWHRAYREIILGTWNQIPDNVLIAVPIEGSYHLIQRSTSGSYFVPRGRNMLESPSVTITNPGFDLDLIASDESDIGGLMPPDNFPAAAFAALGFEYDSGSGEWHRINNGGDDPGGGDEDGDDNENPGNPSDWSGTAGAIEKIDLSVAAETQNDTLNLGEFRATYDYSKFIASFGFGSPYYRGEANAPIEPIAAGWSHVNSAQTYPDSILPGKNVASFQFFHYYEGGNLFTSARAILPEYPSAQAILDQNWDAASGDDTMLEALSHHMVGFWMVADAAAENSYRWGDYSMVDEEQISSHSKLVFALKLLAYTSNLQPDKILVYYGYPVLSLFWGGSHWQDRASETDLARWKNEPLFFVPEIRNSRLYFDGNSGYVKSPLPIAETLYQKDGNGNYLLNNGKRQLRTDVFSETLFGIRNTWLDAPNDLLPNDQRSAQPYTHDVKWAVTSPYYMLTKWQLVQIANMNMNGHGYDITRYRDLPNKPISIQSLLTEPWTYGGNQRYRRWISEEQIKFILMAPLMMGFAGVELWEGGWLAERFFNPDYPGRSWGANIALGYKGSPQYPHWSYEGSPQYTTPGFDENTLMSENFSRFKWATKAVSEMRKVYSHYTKDETLRFLHFTRHGTAVADREIILMGLYQGANMHLLAWYPYHDPQDNTEVKIRVRGQEYRFTVEGRKVGLYHLAIAGNPEPHEITAEYTTIDGDHKIITADLDQHTTLPSTTYNDWSSQHGNRPMQEDTDGDSAINLLEYAFGMDPETSDSPLLPNMRQSTSGPELIFRRNVRANDLNYTVETTTDLISEPWRPIAQLRAFVSPVLLPGIPETFTIATRSPEGESDGWYEEIRLYNTSEDMKRFFRVKVDTLED